MKYAILALAACVPLAACNTAPAADPAAIATAVKAVEAGMLAAYKAHDAAKVASFYTADADIMVPNAPPMRGADAAVSMKDQFQDPNFSIDFKNERTEVASAGDMAFTHGSFHVTYTNPANKQAGAMDGSYVTVFRKQADGSWKVVQDISTPGVTATPPQDAPVASNG